MKREQRTVLDKNNAGQLLQIKMHTLFRLPKFVLIKNCLISVLFYKKRRSIINV